MHGFLSFINRLAFVLEPLFYKLLFMSVIAVIIGFIILLIRKFFDKKISPSWKMILWSVFLFSLIIPYRPVSSFSLAGPISQIEEISFRDDFDKSEKELKELTIFNEDENVTSAELEAVKTKNNVLYAKSAVFDLAVPVAWLFGSAALGAFFILSKLILNQKIKKSKINSQDFSDLVNYCKKALNLKVTPRVTVQSYLKTPAVMGVFSPNIILPSCYDRKADEEKLKFVFLHELSHFKRGDLIINFLLLVLSCVYWFNPFVWMIFQFIREDMEVLCDSYVATKIGSKNYKSYALSLVSALDYNEKTRVIPKMVCLVDNAKNVERRIKMLKLKEKFSNHMLAISACSLVVIGLLAVFFLTKPPKEIFGEKLISETVSSFSFDVGEISFKIPKNAKIDDSFKLMVSGRTSDGGGMSVHLFENEAENNSWKSGKTYKIDIGSNNYSQLNFSIYSGENQYEADLIKLCALNFAHKYRTDYIGDAPKVGHIAAILTNVIDESLSYDGIELHTNDVSDLGVVIYLNVDRNIYNTNTQKDPAIVHKKLKQTALEIMSLIGNAKNVSIVGTDDRGAELLLNLQKDEAEKLLGESYYNETKTIDGFINLSNEIYNTIFAPEEENGGNFSKSLVPSKISFDKDENIPKLSVVAALPNSWELVSDDSEDSIYLPGDFSKILTIFDKNKNIPIAKIGATSFIPYEEEIEEENYYKTVYTELRLSNFFHYDPYETVLKFDDGETGVADLYYLDPKEIENYLGSLPSCPSVETKAILSYNKNLGVYIGISFAEGVLSEEEIKEIAKSLTIVPYSEA